MTSISSSETTSALTCRPGTISPEPGVFLASTKLDATFTGLAAHSGADPQKGKNALLAGAAAALAIHGITRPIGEVTALNVGTLVAGQGRNVVAPNAFMQLEVRGETEELNAYMRDQAIRKIKASADMYDCQVDIVKAGEATEFKPDPGSHRTCLYRRKKCDDRRTRQTARLEVRQ